MQVAHDTSCEHSGPGWLGRLRGRPRPPHSPVVGGSAGGQSLGRWLAVTINRPQVEVAQLGDTVEVELRARARRQGHGAGRPAAPLRGLRTGQRGLPDQGRDPALSGGVGQALAAQGGELFSADPSIQNIDVLAYKLPGENG